jgi:hypothetical protein
MLHALLGACWGLIAGGLALHSTSIWRVGCSSHGKGRSPGHTCRVTYRHQQGRRCSVWAGESRRLQAGSQPQPCLCVVLWLAWGGWGVCGCVWGVCFAMWQRKPPLHACTGPRALPLLARRLSSSLETQVGADHRVMCCAALQGSCLAGVCGGVTAGSLLVPLQQQGGPWAATPDSAAAAATQYVTGWGVRAGCPCSPAARAAAPIRCVSNVSFLKCAACTVQKVRLPPLRPLG